MAFVIQMPKLGHTMTEGTVLEWHKHEGDSVKQGESILTVETDKAQVEVESPVDGTLGRQVASQGQVVQVGGAVGVIVNQGEEVPSDIAGAEAGAPAADASVSAPGEKRPESSTAAPVRAAGGKVLASPRAKRLAAERGIDLSAITGTGPNGLVTEDDVKNASAGAPSAALKRAAGGRVLASPRAKRLAAERGIDLSAITGTGSNGLVTEDDVKSASAGALSSGAPQTGVAPTSDAGPLWPSRREKLTRIQAVGARNLGESWRNVPHFVQMVRVDMSRALAARKALAESGTRLSVGDVILAAAVRALRDNPRVNASYADGEMIVYEHVNLGVAVDTPDGLLVPVIHEAERLDPPALSARVAELAERARVKRLGPADMEGATFTVSNLGAYGVDNGTPVIFAPQSALMFVGAIRDEVLAVNGRPEVRPAMQIAIAYDHRGVDGATASRFTTGVKGLLESADFLGAPSVAAAAAPPRRHEVTVESMDERLVTQVRYGTHVWEMSGEEATDVDPVTGFLGTLGSCLLMSLRVGARVRKVSLGRVSLIARANEKGHVKKIEVELKVETDVDDEKLKHLVEVAERGCHIRQVIRDDIEVTVSVNRMS